MTRGDRDTARRAYDNSGRTAAAAATRARILDAARDLLVSEGYAAMSITALARAAGVSPQTIYNAIGGKAEVLKACYDVTLAGDDEPVPLSERPAFRRMFDAPDAAGFVTAYAAWCRVVHDRVAPILGGVLRGRGGDPAADAFLETVDGERRIGTTHAVAHLADAHGLPAGLSREHAVDLTWTLNAPEVYDRLVRRCGWSPVQYERWLSRQLAVALIG